MDDIVREASQYDDLVLDVFFESSEEDDEAVERIARQKSQTERENREAVDLPVSGK
jgi:hypothetical protein